MEVLPHLLQDMVLDRVQILMEVLVQILLRLVVVTVVALRHHQTTAEELLLLLEVMVYLRTRMGARGQLQLPLGVIHRWLRVEIRTHQAALAVLTQEKIQARLRTAMVVLPLGKGMVPVRLQMGEQVTLHQAVEVAQILRHLEGTLAHLPVETVASHLVEVVILLQLPEAGTAVLHR